MKALTKISIGFLALAAAALWFTSCSSEDVASGTNQGKMSSLTLTINTGKSMGSRATDWTTTDPGADKANTENKINRAAIGIFSSDGTVKTIVELTPSATSTTGTNSLTQDDANKATAKIVTSSLVANDEVLVAINAPTGTFTGCQDKDAFMKKTETAAEALANYNQTSLPDPTEQVANNIPMFGSASLSGSGSSFTANVTVIHMIAKVSLTELKVDFKAGSAYADAQFTPKAVFLINVPKTFQFDNSTDAQGDYNNAWLSEGYEHGWGTFATNYDANTANTDAATTYAGSTFAKYLTTSELTGKTLEGEKGEDSAPNAEASYDKQVYFYTMPNGKADNNATKLVIAGLFTSAKAGITDKVVYYPLFLNATVNSTGTGYDPAFSGSEAKKVYPNKNYDCKVVIRTIGAGSPNTDLTPQAASITITVKDFDTATQNTEFN